MTSTDVELGWREWLIGVGLPLALLVTWAVLIGEQSSVGLVSALSALAFAAAAVLTGRRVHRSVSRRLAGQPAAATSAAATAVGALAALAGVLLLRAAPQEVALVVLAGAAGAMASGVPAVLLARRSASG